MRILFITTMWGGQKGGSEVLWSKTAQLALQEGHAVTIYFPEMGAYGAHIQQLKAAGATLLLGKKVAVATTLKTRVNKKLFGDAKDVREKKLESLLRTAAVDAICVSQGGTVNFPYEKNLSRIVVESGIPFVLISQHNYEHGVVHNPSFRQYVVSVFAAAAKVCFVAARNRQVAEIQLAAAIPNGIVIDNPIQVSRGMVPWPADDGVMRLAFIGRLNVSNKGLDMLMNALSQCRDQEVKWTLDLYGEGEDADYLKELVTFLQLQHQVFFKGYESDVAKIWASHEALLLPSANEGTPLVVVEAMSCGRPVIATDVGDSGRFVLQHQTGILIEAPFAPVIKRAFIDLLQHRNDLQQWGKNAYEHALKETAIDPCENLLGLIVASTHQKTKQSSSVS